MKRYGAMWMVLMACVTIFAGCSAKTDTNAVNGTETKTIEYDAKDYVKLGKYKNLEVDYIVPQVTMEDLDMQVQELIEENVEYTEITDRPSKEGDSVNIDYTGTIDKVEFEGGSDTGFDLILGSGEFLEDFEKNLIGTTVGQTVTFPVTFPQDYEEELAGKQAEFTVKVNSISEVNKPLYNDELIKKATEYKTVQEYEEAIQGELMISATQESESMAGEEALKIAVKNATISGYPSELYEVCYGETLDSYQSTADMFGVEVKDFLAEYMEMDEQDVKDEAMSWVNDILVVEAIADKEGLAITDKNYKERAEELALEYGYESLADFEKDYSRISIESSIVREDVVSYLVEHAKLIEKSEEVYDEELSTE